MKKEAQVEGVCGVFGYDRQCLYTQYEAGVEFLPEPSSAEYNTGWSAFPNTRFCNARLKRLKNAEALVEAQQGCTVYKAGEARTESRVKGQSTGENPLESR